MKMVDAISSQGPHSIRRMDGLSDERIFADFPLLQADACDAYLDQYLNLSTISREERKTIAQVLSGRARLATAFVTRVLAAETDVGLMGMLEQFVADMCEERECSRDDETVSFDGARHGVVVSVSAKNGRAS